MAVKHIQVFSYIGSDNVSWTSAENGFDYICETVKTHGTDEEYAEIIRRREHTLALNPTDELINETLIKRTTEFADENAMQSAYSTFLEMSKKTLFLSINDKIEFLETRIYD